MPRPDGFEAARAGGGEEISVFAGFDLSVRAAEEMIKRRAFLENLEMSDANRIDGMYLQEWLGQRT